MSPAEGISKLGFRRWYERQLIESHAYLVTGFLCLILIAASFEGFSIREMSASSFITLATMFAAGVVGCGALKRYIDVLQRAEHIAEHSVCTSCKTYGRLTIVGSSREQAAADELSPVWMRVACRKCGHQWLID
jgi:hypothetical protein